MRMTQKVEFNEYWIPPRCRVERLRRSTAVVTAEIREVTAAEAPIAVIQRRDVMCVDHLGHGRRIEYRWYDGRLFARVRVGRFICLNGKPDRQARPRDIYVDSWFGCTTPAGAQAKYERIMSRYLLVDGKLCIESGEPRYVIYTGGLGCNHGHTSLGVDHSYNPNISWQRYVRCDRMSEAVALHRRIAKSRGDTKSLPSRGHARFEVLMPEVLGVDPQAQHGDGDPFINKVEGIVETLKDPVASGLLGMAMAFSHVG